jgi:ADP-ribosylglycohydrolase
VSYGFEPLFHEKSKITDDTICSLAVMDGLLNNEDPSTVIRRWGRTYWSTGGWGKLFAQWLASSDPQPYGSYGNGAAMRIASVGWVGQSEREVISSAERFTEVTHNHPDGIVAGTATALAVFYARSGYDTADIKNSLKLYYNLDFKIADVIDNYERSEIAKESVPHAILCALEAINFEDAIRKAVSLGGDTDTQAAIAGGIAEARFGVPTHIKDKTLTYLDDDMKRIVEAFYCKFYRCQ